MWEEAASLPRDRARRVYRGPRRPALGHEDSSEDVVFDTWNVGQVHELFGGEAPPLEGCSRLTRAESVFRPPEHADRTTPFSLFPTESIRELPNDTQIGRASCRERV